MEHIHRKGKLVSSKMIETGAKIMVKDIKTKAKVTIIGSHVNEVPPETIRFLRKKSKLILADAQGMMRKIDDKKNVLLTNLKKTSFWNVLDKVDFLKMSEEEAELVDLSEIKKKTTLVITLSKKGCWIISEKENTSVPTTPLGEKDSTGAGDFFLAGFSWALHKGLPLKTCAEIANYCGGLAVKAVGLPKVTHEMIKGTLLATQGKLSH